MNTTLAGIAGSNLDPTRYDDLSTTIGLAVIVVLAALLATRDFAPMLRGSSAPRVTRALDTAIVPLFVTFATIVLARLAELLS